MGIFFKYVIYFFNDKLLYEASFKAIYLIGAVILGLIFYLLIAILIKAFKRSDINLNY
jgi:putative peptidoglycan lipid II flippase